MNILQYYRNLRPKTGSEWKWKAFWLTNCYGKYLLNTEITNLLVLHRKTLPLYQEMIAGGAAGFCQVNNGNYSPLSPNSIIKEAKVGDGGLY